MLDYQYVKEQNGLQNSPVHRYSFDVKTAVKRWVDGSFNPADGIIFKANANVEGGTNYKSKCFASYNYAGNDSSRKPSLTINYTTAIIPNDHFSKYDPQKFNYSGYNLPYDLFDLDSDTYVPLSESPLCRMNCYGYALGDILDYDVYFTNYTQGYMQYPGQFSFNNCSSSFNSLDQLLLYMQYDTTRKTLNENYQLVTTSSYTISEYTLTSSAPAQFGTDSRLIAAVIEPNSHLFHFYVQHNDGTWSHKDGKNVVRNTSLGTNKILTNENIYFLANEGSYANGLLGFYLISRKTINDYPHDSPQSPSFTKYRDKAGDYPETALTITQNTLDGKIDYGADRDVFRFYTSSSGILNISTSIASNLEQYDLNCKVYTNEGTVIYSDTGQGQVDLDCSLSSNTCYYIEIYNQDFMCTEYTLELN